MLGNAGRCCSEARLHRCCTHLSRSPNAPASVYSGLFPLSLLAIIMAATAVTPAVPKGTAAALQLVKCKVSASLLPGNLVAGSALTGDSEQQPSCNDVSVQHI